MEFHPIIGIFIILALLITVYIIFHFDEKKKSRQVMLKKPEPPKLNMEIKDKKNFMKMKNAEVKRQIPLSRLIRNKIKEQDAE